MALQDDDDYPGRRLGMPESGPGAVAGWGRRFLALIIDMFMSRLVFSLFVGSEAFYTQEGQALTANAAFTPLVIFVVEATLLTALAGGSAGQLICGVQVRRVSRAPLDIPRALLRSFLICLVIPPVIYNRDQQGLHDLAVDSIALRR